MRKTLHRVTNWLLLGLAIAIGAGIVSLAGMPSPVRAAVPADVPMPPPAACETMGQALAAVDTYVLLSGQPVVTMLLAADDDMALLRIANLATGVMVDVIYRGGCMVGSRRVR